MSKQTKTTLAALLATSVAAFAGTTTKTTKAPEKESEPFVSGVLGVEVSSGYVNKGREYDTNPVFQPFAAVIIPTKLELGGVDVAVVGSTRQNLHTKHPQKSWASSEYNAGLSIKKDRFVLTSTYEWFRSEKNWFSDTEGVNLTLNFNDQGLGPVALNPHVKSYLGTKRENNQSTGNYYEVGIAPSVGVFNTEVALPVNVGYGDKNFYNGGKNYGYTSVGITTATPILKNVSLITGVTYFNTNEKINSGKNDLWLTSAGIVVKF